MTMASDNDIEPDAPVGGPDTGPPDSAQPGARRRSWRPLLLRLHFYAGIFVAPFIVIAAITGALYAVAPTLESVVYHDLVSVEPGGPALPLSDQVVAAQAAAPGLPVTGQRPAAAATESTRVYFSDPGLPEDTYRAVFVNPHTGEVLGSQRVWFGFLPLSAWLDGLHRHLQLGEPGRVYSELAASWLWVIAGAGLCLRLINARTDRRRGRPGRVLRIARRATGRSRTLGWHGATGVWILLALVFLSATGITWSTYAGAHVTDIRTHFHWQRPQLDTTAAADPESTHHAATAFSHEPVPTEVDFDRVLAVAADAGVHAPVEITLPAEPGQAIAVTETDRAFRLTTNAVAIDPVTLQPTDALDYYRDYSVVAKLADWGIRAHMGTLFGLLNQLLLLTVAVALLVVIGAGYRMWWQRRPTRGSAWAVGRPPLRGAFRNLSPVTAIVGGVVAVGVAGFLPLLGATLLAFLAVDAGVAATKRPANPIPAPRPPS